MRCAPRGDRNNISRVEQFREARQKMLGLTFNDYEKEIREHLTGMFPKELFNFDRDVQSITVNRWAHGYAYGHVGPVGRRPFGRIAIANSDAGNSSYFHVASEQAYRAIEELS